MTSLRRNKPQPALSTLGGLQIWLICGLFLVLVGCAAARDTILVEIRGHIVHAELALTVPEQSRGLMYRKSLPRDGGMLFVYREPEVASYWMKNTFIPLSIAFIDSQKRIINMLEMAPNDSLSKYRSRRPCLYVLEVNQGWFQKHGIQEGDEVRFQLPQASR